MSDEMGDLDIVGSPDTRSEEAIAGGAKSRGGAKGKKRGAQEASVSDKPPGKGGVKANKKLKTGCKQCRTCGGIFSIETDFSGNSADDKRCASVIATLRNVARAQGLEAWFLEQMADPVARKRMVDNYNVRCPARTDKGPRGVFPLSQYYKEILKEKSLIKDAVWEFMDQKAYIAFMNTPQKGNVLAAKAMSMWQEMINNPSVVKDELGDCSEYKTRCAVKVKDLLIDRSADVIREGLRLAEKENKNTSDADVQKLLNRLLGSKLDEEGMGDLETRIKSLVAEGSHKLGGASSLNVADVARQLGNLKAADDEAVKEAQVAAAAASQAGANEEAAVQTSSARIDTNNDCHGTSA